MRNSGIRGYSGYRGRRPRATHWLAIVLALFLLGALGFLFAQHYIVYETNGSHHYEWPWARHTGKTQPEQPSGQELEIVIERPEGTSRESVPILSSAPAGENDQPAQPK